MPHPPSLPGLIDLVRQRCKIGARAAQRDNEDIGVVQQFDPDHARSLCFGHKPVACMAFRWKK